MHLPDRSACRLCWLVILLLLFGAGCARDEDVAALRGDEVVRLRLADLEVEAAEAPAYQPDSRTLRIAIAAVVSPRETWNTYRDLLDYLGRRLSRPVELVQGKTYAEINDLVRSGALTGALVCTNPYLEGQEAFGMEALAIPIVRGKPVYYSYLIVHQRAAPRGPEDSGFQSLEQLRGRTFAFTDPLSNSGRLAPLYQLALLGQRPETFFRRHIFTYSHDNSIRAVAEGLVDAASVDSLVYDYWAINQPELTARTRILARWGPYGINPFVVHPDLDPELKAQLRQVLLGMHQDPEGQAILERLLVDQFAVPDERIYDSVREMRAYFAGRRSGQPGVGGRE